MRLHQLTVTAFGPFAGTERVDFDELNTAGLFLLTGPTGAGKSSLLDAVCFALYGTVPGVRGVKTLKSQHASSEARPEVELDVTVQGRRFVVRRTPEWTRPKKRGDGVLSEKASASIMETTGGTEQLLSSRAAEVGHLVTSLMGMNAAQFQQVALLPQGEFQTFLRASSQERHDVLQHLFRTDRFAAIETWVNEHSRRLRDEAGEGEAAVRRLVDTVADRVGAEVPDELGGETLARAAADGQVLPWVSGLLARTRTAVESARTSTDQAQHALHTARHRHEQAVRRAERRSRRAVARDTLAELEASSGSAAAAQQAVDGHERARRCLDVLTLRDDAVRACDEAAIARQAALSRVRDLTVLAPLGDLTAVSDLTDADLVALLDETAGRVARLEALAPREAQTCRLREERDRDQERLRAAEQELQDAAARCEQLPADTSEAEQALAAAVAHAAREDALRLTLGSARRRLAAAVDLVDVRRELEAAEDARRDARDATQDARDVVQRLAARRLTGMAAELAASLTDGAACQVCGSTEHPRPAVRGHDHVTESDQQVADEALAACAGRLEAAEAQARAHRDRHESLVAAADGADATVVAAVVASTTRELELARVAGQRVPALERSLSELRRERDSLGRRQASAAIAAAGLREAVAAQTRTLVAFEGEAASALAPHSATTVHAALEELARLRVRLSTAREAVARHEETTRRLDALTEQAHTSAAEQGFDDLVDVEAALLGDDELRALTAQLQERAATRSRAQAVLEEPEDEPEGTGPDPEVDEVSTSAHDLQACEASAVESARELALCDDRAAALARYLHRLEEAIEGWAPVRDDALRAEAMSRLVRGMGHDNQLQMRLSAYVLATRLDQVVAAANERLGHLRDQRYLLQRTGRAERRSAQAGLGLEVVDQWTGDVRAPTTLSGGETFVVSLALALGLADVVTHEAGGTEVETLFVDEGFGTLDADTLDDVMDRLDGLRAGGRTVGVVSHVSELRSRIPTQVLVEKGRAGSTVSVATLVG